MATKTLIAAKKAPAKKVAAKKASKPIAATKKAPIKKATATKALDDVLAAQGPFIQPVVATTKAKPAKVEPKATKEPKVAREGTKTEIAEAIYLKMKGNARKDIIAEFIDKAKLTVAGAGTYYSNFKKKHG